MTSSLKTVVLNALSAMKAHDLNDLDVGAITNITEYMIIATGTSTTHVRSISEAILKETKKLNYLPIGIEGEKEAEWVLIDLGDIIVHVMLPSSRAFYNLEKLWAPFEVEAAISA